MRGLKTAVASASALCFLSFGAPSASAVAPTIPLSTFSEVTTSSVTLEADVNPQKKATKYHFEYGLADCSLGPCTITPVPDAKAGSGAAPVRVKAPIEGLAPGTAYHFRLVAKNNSGTTEGPDTVLTTFSLAPVFGPCANDPFRGGALLPLDHPSANLPDCRAYEQASPIEKNGLDAMGTYPLTKASLDGNRVTFATSSGIPGGQGAQQPPAYLSSRGEGQWSTQGMMPPESAGDQARVQGWTADMATIFAQATRKGEPATKALLARSSAGGPLSEIAPYVERGPPSEEVEYGFAGASADGSKVFFEATQEPLSEDAPAGRDNLYLWDAAKPAAERLSLVGKVPAGGTQCGGAGPACVSPPGGSFAGPYNWAGGTSPLSLSQGGANRQYYTQEEHAISSDGSSVYFTAGTSGQVYRRTDPAAPAAATVRVSASEKTNGHGPGGTDANGAAPAAFMAATPDGAHAFLTSSEKLTDNATTGPEATHPAAIARAKIGASEGEEVNLDFLPASAGAVEAGGGYVYWADEGEGKAGEGTIGRAKLGAGGPAEVEAEFIPNEIAGVTVVDNPRGIAVDAEHLYWTNADDGEAGTGTIGRADLPANPGDPVTNAAPSCVTGLDNPQGIDVDAGYVYWANAVTNPPRDSGTVGRADLACATPGSVNKAFVDDVAGGDVAVNASKIYFSRTNGSSGFIRSANVADGSGVENLPCTTPLLSSAKEEPSLSLDGSHLYFVNPTSGTIGRGDLPDGCSTTSFVPDAGNPKGLAADATHLYWSANQTVLPNPGNDLYRYDAEALPGHHLTDLTVDGADENGAEVRGVLGASADGSRVYFVANGVLSAAPNSAGESAAPGNCPARVQAPSGACNLYLSEEGEIAFVARLALAAGSENSDALNWTPTQSGLLAGSAQKTARVTAGGDVLLFRSQRRLTSYDNQTRSELYRYQAGDGSLLCVSCNPTGAPPSGLLGSYPSPSLVIPASPAATLSRSLSVDGNRVFFASTEALVGADTNGDQGCPAVGSELQGYSACQDVYEWEARGAGSCDSEAQNGGCLYLLSTGKSSAPSFFLDASATGEDAFLLTRSGLVGQDGDQLMDVYDARAGGGLSAQSQPPPEECEGEACKAGATPPPTSQSAGSASFKGPGNHAEGHNPSRCPKGKHAVRRHGKTRCARKHRAHRGGGQRKAKTTGRASR